MVFRFEELFHHPISFVVLKENRRAYDLQADDFVLSCLIFQTQNGPGPEPRDPECDAQLLIDNCPGHMDFLIHSLEEQVFIGDIGGPEDGSGRGDFSV